MKLGYVFTLLAVAAFATPLLTGCTPDSDTATATSTDLENADDHHGHDHGDGHDHDHGDEHADGELPAHGPNKGHLFRLDGTDMVGEWIHYSNNDIIRVLLLDSALKNAVDFDGVEITPKAGDEKTPFVLELDPDKNPEGKKVVYMLEEKRLMLAMNLGVDVEYTVGDKTYKGSIAPHAPHDH